MNEDFFVQVFGLLRAVVAALVLAAMPALAGPLPLTVGEANLAGSASVPRAAKGLLIVKYRDSVTESVHLLLERGGSFQSATTDASSALDELHRRYQVRAAKPLFRRNPRRGPVTGTAPSSREALDQDEQRHREETLARFPMRSRRASTGVMAPDLSHVYVLGVPDDTNIAQAVEDFARNPHVAYAEPDLVMEVRYPTTPTMHRAERGVRPTMTCGA